MLSISRAYWFLVSDFFYYYFYQILVIQTGSPILLAVQSSHRTSDMSLRSELNIVVIELDYSYQLRRGRTSEIVKGTRTGTDKATKARNVCCHISECAMTVGIYSTCIEEL